MKGRTLEMTHFDFFLKVKKRMAIKIGVVGFQCFYEINSFHRLFDNN